MTDNAFNWSVDRPDPLALAFAGSTLPVVPAPEIPCHDVTEDCPVPSAARRFADKAAGYGWTVRITHARGPKLHSTHGTVTSIVDSIAVRIARGHRRAYAVWLNGKFNGTDYPAQFLVPGESLDNYGAVEMAAALQPDQEDRP